MSELTGTLKLYAFATTGVASLASFCFLVQLTLVLVDFNAFIRALIGLGLSLLLAVVEFKDIAPLFQYASFYYSYLGRGALLFLLLSLLSIGPFFTVITGFLLFAGSILHIVLHVLPNVAEPPSFKRGSAALSVGNDEDDFI